MSEESAAAAKAAIEIARQRALLETPVPEKKGWKAPVVRPAPETKSSEPSAAESALQKAAEMARQFAQRGQNSE